jgi:parallel beta-helix repeat protein
MNKKQRFILLIACLNFVGLIAGIHSTAYGTTFYVDFVNGSDSNNGVSSSMPFKHCPGDNNATGVVAATALSPGDTVLFRGGVKYRGSINLSWSGNAGNPITYKGNGWGTGKAIITGADPFPYGWTACTSQAACRNNPNWSNIYYASLPAGMGFYNRLFQNDQFVYWAQDPNPANKLNWTSLGEWRSISPSLISKTTLTDTAYFTQSDANYLNESYVLIWVQGNATEITPITGFNPSAHAISYSLSGTPYTDRSDYYTILNHPAHIDSAGEYAISSTDNKIYLWPAGNLNPNSQLMEISTRTKAISGGTVNYLTFDGLIVMGTYGSQGGAWDEGGGISVSGGTGITVKNCEIKYLSSMTGMNAIRLPATSNVLVDNNSLHDLLTNRGILVSGSTGTVSNNTIHDIGGTGIWFAGISGGLIQNNIVYDILGVHSNGVSVYSNSSNVVIEKNVLKNMGQLLTFEQSSNLTVRNNLIDGYGYGLINDWGGMTGYVNFINNTMVNGGDHNILRFLSGTANKTVINNIIDGGGIAQTHIYNIYTGLAWNQGAGYGWYPGTGEVTGKTNSDLFTDPNARNYTLLSSGPAANTGADVSAYGVFQDIQGTTRPQGPAWDIGAYEATTDLKKLSPPQPKLL